MTLIVFAVPISRCFRSSWWACGCSRMNTGPAHLHDPVRKVLGVGVTAFVFDVTRDKLLEMHWFERLYELVMELRAKAKELVEPIKQRIRELLAGNGEGWSARTLRLIQRFRKGVHQAR